MYVYTEGGPAKRFVVRDCHTKASTVAQQAKAGQRTDDGETHGIFASRAEPHQCCTCVRVVGHQRSQKSIGLFASYEIEVAGWIW
mmetsp:Transcript_68463/g.111125  ORF Transcript_68463/g.111125 Transcript_68463/m.111125 type:complete len:85 (-) Transcript_68463:669-923(-)